VTFTISLAITLVLAVWGIRRLAQIAFTSRLEAIRDDCEDAVLDGRLREKQQVKELLSRLDDMMKYGRRVTYARLLALRLAASQVGLDIVAEAQTEELSYSGLQPTERRIMHELEERLLQAWVSYVNLSTPLGWAHTVASRIGRRLRPGKPNRRAQADSLPTLAAKDVCRLPARRSPITGRRLGVRVGR